MRFDEFLPYLAVMALVTYLVRAVPLVLFKRRIRNRFVLSFLYYMPYAVLTVMTIPAVFYATDHLLSAAAGVALGLITAFLKPDLLLVALSASSGVLIAEWILKLLGM